MRVKTRVAGAAAALALLIAGCAGAAVGREVAATVDGHDIPSDMLAVLVDAQRESDDRPAPEEYAAVEQLQRETLAQLIRDEIAARAAGDLGIEVSQDAVEERFNELAERFGGPEALRQEIAEAGRTEAEIRSQIAAVIRRERLQEHFAGQAEVTDAEIRAAYDRALDDEYRVADVSHILVETSEQAEDLRAQLDAGADFGELAREHSSDELSAVNAGALGEQPRGRYIEAFDEAVWNAEPGEIVGPVQTRFGFHLIKVNGFREIPLSEVEPRIRQELQAEASQGAFDEWFREVVAAADVRVDPRIGRWDPATATVTPTDAIPERGSVRLDGSVATPAG
ncbi:MAG: peptidylprolyl isomerase [Actinomycetota bacterium]|nr:peptidylprolyl isomerase [Actinomycetota bacterium]